MEKDRFQSNLILMKGELRKEIWFWMNVSNNRRRDFPKAREGAIDEQIRGFIKEREKALKDNDALLIYLLSRYLVLLRLSKTRQFSDLIDKDDFKDGADFFRQLLFPEDSFTP